MRSLGVDASLTCTGFAVIETDGIPGHETVTRTWTVKTAPPDEDVVRCDQIALAALGAAREHGVDLVGVEKPFVGQGKSPATALRLQRLDVTIETVLRQAGIEVVTVPVASVKSALGIRPGTDRAAGKRAALDAVNRRYNLALTDDNRADAIGVALAAVRLQWRRQRAGQIALPGVKQGRRRVKKAGGAS